MSFDQRFVRAVFEDKLERAGVDMISDGAYEGFRDGAMGNEPREGELSLEYHIYGTWYSIGKRFREKYEKNRSESEAEREKREAGESS